MFRCGFFFFLGVLALHEYVFILKQQCLDMRNHLYTEVSRAKHKIRLYSSHSGGIWRSQMEEQGPVREEALFW